MKLGAWSTAELAERGAEMAALPSLYDDAAWWSRYALNMALLDSAAVERSPLSRAWAHAKAVAIRQDVAYSFTASGEVA